MKFSALRRLNDRLAATTSLMEKEAIIRDIMVSCSSTEERIAAAMMLTGKLATPEEGWTTGIKESFLAKELALEGRQSLESIAQVAMQRAQVGDYLKSVLGFWTNMRVYLREGDRSIKRKSALVNDILFEGMAQVEDIPFAFQVLCGKVRNGVGDILIVNALFQPKDREDFARRFALNPDLAEWVTLSDNFDDKDAVAKVLDGLPTVSRPLEPQLCARVNDLAKVLIEHKGMTMVQPKLDGMRVHLHLQRLRGGGMDIKIFSRTMKEMSKDYPDVAVACWNLPFKQHVILDGELVALDNEGGVAPFSILQTRLGRKTGRDAVRVGVVVYDLLLLDQTEITKMPYALRMGLLQRLLKDNPDIRPIESEMCASLPRLKERLMEAYENGEEGLVCKDPNSLPEPGARSKSWIKCKPSYSNELGDTYDLAVIGYEDGRGRRHGKVGALWCAIRDKDEFLPICKVGTGFTDDDLVWWTEAMLTASSPVERKPFGVSNEVEPEYVIEVKADMVTRSADGSLSLRFPRFVRLRTDKTPRQATTLSEIDGPRKRPVT